MHWRGRCGALEREVWSTKYEGVVHWIGMWMLCTEKRCIALEREVICARVRCVVHWIGRCGALEREVWCTGEGGVEY